MKRLVGIVLLLLGTLGIAQAQDIANWTILHYTAVDNNLEGAAFNDYYEMQTAGSGAGVNIVAQLDRAEGFDERFGGWTDTRRFYIEQVPPLPPVDEAGKRAALVEFFTAQGYSDAETGVAALDANTVNAIYENNNVGVFFDQAPVEELGEVDMGEPQALFDFIMWGAANFPAEHYMIVIGSHGGGWRGLGPDDGNDHSMLDLPEIDQALAAAREQLGIDKFDIVGFDACLMGVTDVAVMLEPHADYVLFSQEVIPSNGWEYTNSIAAMQANPDWDAFQVGANFIDNYMAYYAGVGARTKVDLGMVETAGLPALLGAMENFAQVVSADTVELLSALGSARNNSQIFGASLGDRADVYSYVDLKDFMTWFSLQTTITEEAYNAAQEVLAAYDSAVVYAQADSKLPRSTGLSLYLPTTPPIYEAYGTDYPVMAPAPMAFWQDYLQQFYSTIVTELDGSALQLQINNIFTLGEQGSTVDTPVVFFDAAGKGVIDLSYVVSYVQDDGSRVIVDTAPISYNSVLPAGETVIEYPNELTPSTFTWGVEFPLVSDGTNQVLSVLQSNSSSGSESIIYGTYVTAEGSQPAVLIFDSSSNTYQGMLAIADSSPYEVKPNPGDQFIVDLIRILPDGTVEQAPQTDVPLTFGLEPFTLSYSPAVSGTYYVGLTITDLAGNRQFQQAELTINNDEVDGSLRGYTDTNEGLYFQYPFAWGQSVTVSNEDGSLTEIVSDDAGTLYISATAYAETDPQTALDTVLGTVGAAVGEVAESTLAGQPALRADYTLDLESGPLAGVAYALVHPETGSAIVLQVESSGDPALNAELESLLDSTLILFAPQ